MSIGAITGNSYGTFGTFPGTMRAAGVAPSHYPPTGYAADRSFIQTAGGAFNGGLNAYQNGAAVAGALKGVAGGAQGGIKVLGQALLKGTQMSVLIGAGVSVLSNAAGVMNGSITVGRALGNVTADSAGAAVSGVVAAGAGGLAAIALGALGVASGGIVLGASALAGAAGFLLSDRVYSKSKLRQAISDTIAGVL